MRDLDETDMEILSLLAENAPSLVQRDRRGSRPLGTSRLRSRHTAPRDGIINHFTINVDRSRLRAGVPILVKLDLPSESFDAVRERVRNDDAVEFALTCAECSNTVDSEGKRVVSAESSIISVVHRVRVDSKSDQRLEEGM